ncbi:hypothetical protein CFII64_03002 [Pseudomonas sp. CFII64]|nr:hypothetical protein CFII64_03002 [Pseudomonas sp. CFII64]
MFFRRRNIYATPCLFWTPRRALLIPTKEHLQIVGVIGEYAQACLPQKIAIEHLTTQIVMPILTESCRLRRAGQLKVTSAWVRYINNQPQPLMAKARVID